MSEASKSRPEIGMLLFPGLNFLDLIGPHTLLAHSANVHLVWKNLDLLTVESGIAVKPTTKLKTAPRSRCLLFPVVPALWMSCRTSRR